MPSRRGRINYFSTQRTDQCSVGQCSVGQGTTRSSRGWPTADWALMFLTPCRVCHTRRSLRRAPARSRVGYCPRFCSLCMRDPSRHPAPPTIASALFTAHSNRHRHPTPLPPTLPPSTLPNPAHSTSFHTHTLAHTLNKYIDLIRTEASSQAASRVEGGP